MAWHLQKLEGNSPLGSDLCFFMISPRNRAATKMFGLRLANSWGLCNVTQGNVIITGHDSFPLLINSLSIQGWPMLTLRPISCDMPSDLRPSTFRYRNDLRTLSALTMVVNNQYAVNLPSLKVLKFICGL